jgi:hypothetical protein
MFRTIWDYICVGAIGAFFLWLAYRFVQLMVYGKPEEVLIIGALLSMFWAYEQRKKAKSVADKETV